MSKKGFTLIETVVAVTVLTFALGGPYLLAARSLHDTAYSREEVIASRLAEEGLELAHNIRDNNSAAAVTGGWMQDLISCSGAHECFFTLDNEVNSSSVSDPHTFWGDGSNGGQELVVCAGATCTGNAAEIYYYPSTGAYEQFQGAVPAGWVDAAMKRIIRIDPATDNGATGNPVYQVESEVDYVAGGGWRKVVLEDQLMNWFPTLPIS